MTGSEPIGGNNSKLLNTPTIHCCTYFNDSILNVGDSTLGGNAKIISNGSNQNTFGDNNITLGTTTFQMTNSNTGQLP